MPPKNTKRSKVSIIRFIYLYLITAITFIVFIIGAVTIVDQALKSFVFGVEEYDYYDRPVAIPYNCEKFLDTEGNEIMMEAYNNCIAKQELESDLETEKSQSTFTNESKRRLSIGVAQVIVGFPLWLFHWRIIERDRKKRLAKK